MSNIFGRYLFIVLAAIAVSACSLEQDADTLVISPETEGIIVLTVYLTTPDGLAKALDLIQRGTTQEMTKRPGFMASALHKNIDGTALCQCGAPT